MSTTMTYTEDDRLETVTEQDAGITGTEVPSDAPMPKAATAPDFGTPFISIHFVGLPNSDIARDALQALKDLQPRTADSYEIHVPSDHEKYVTRHLECELRMRLGNETATVPLRVRGWARRQGRT